MQWIKLDGTVCGTIKTATPIIDNFGKNRLRLDGIWEGTTNNILDCPMHVGNQLADAGVMGEDQAGPWVDSTKRIAVWKTKDGEQTIWGASLGDGLQTQMVAQQPRQQNRQQQSRPPQQQRPATPRPAGAPQAPQTAPQATNGQPQRQASPPPLESPASTRRRIEATFAHCLTVVIKSWESAGQHSVLTNVAPEALQAGAATLFIAMRENGVMLEDPQAPPPITADQKAALAGQRAQWHKLSQVVNGQIIVGPALDAWFNTEVAKHGPLNALTADQANKALDAMVEMILAREKQIEEAKSADPSHPAFTGKVDEIPF